MMWHDGAKEFFFMLSCDSCLHATAAATAAAPMVDDDNNKPVPENHPNPNEAAVGNIFGEWGHSRICS